MTLRARIAWAAALAVAFAIIAASVGLYVATARTLRGAVDQDLIEIAAGELPSPIDPSFRGGVRVGRYGGAGGTLQVVTAAGARLTPAGEQGFDPLPVSERTVEVAAGQHGAFFETVRIGDDPVRILTVPAGPRLAVQLARSLAEVEAVLGDLRRQLVVAGLVGVGLAALLGGLVARRAVRPVDDLTELAEEIAATTDLTRRIGLDDQRDEVGRLAGAFDRMLGELEQARTAQEQLVADASHELRTPLTSLRTNIEVLASLERLAPEDRRALVDDVVLQIDEFADLIGSLVELARGERPVVAPVTVALDALVARTVARLDPDGGRTRMDLGAVHVTGDPDRLELAVANLVENALKYASDGTVEVTVAPGRVQVRDHGPGIPAEDLPHVTQRFYRSPRARDVPGSGLGLAIVRQVAEAHGGHLEVANAHDGGAVVTLHLPA